jgi:hypothetical protein
MKKKLILWYILLLVLVIPSCRKKCPSCGDDLLSWISYKHPDKVVYLGQIGDTLVYDSPLIQSSDDYKANKDAKQPCYSYAELIIGCDIDHHLGRFIIKIYLEKVRNELKFSLHFITWIDGVSEYIFPDTFVKNIKQDIKTVSINGVSYIEALTIENTSASSYEVSKCVFVKDHGLMQYSYGNGNNVTLLE